MNPQPPGPCAGGDGSVINKTIPDLEKQGRATRGIVYHVALDEANSPFEGAICGSIPSSSEEGRTQSLAASLTGGTESLPFDGDPESR